MFQSKFGTRPKVASSHFQGLVPSDGSEATGAAVNMAVRFPWPESSTAPAVMAARRVMGYTGIDCFADAWRLTVEKEKGALRETLRRRWSGAKVATPVLAPVDAILGEAHRVRAGAIVLGWRGQGVFTRLLPGSVSREIVQRSRHLVLAVRTAPRSVRRIVLGYDDSL